MFQKKDGDEEQNPVLTNVPRDGGVGFGLLPSRL
jgi:hypothetical protein